MNKAERTIIRTNAVFYSELKTLSCHTDLHDIIPEIVTVLLYTLTLVPYEGSKDDWACAVSLPKDPEHLFVLKST